MTHAKYAESQISKAKGANKRVNNPCPKERPKREDFCKIIHFIQNAFHYHEVRIACDLLAEKRLIDQTIFPCRPVPLKEFKTLDLSKHHAAGLESVANTYRLYNYEDHPFCRGVFQNNTIVCQNIPMEDEWKRFVGLLVYNENEYERAVLEWQQYWSWMKERNANRWIDQEKGRLNYDQKNMCHCVRLLLSAKNIFLNGEPIVRFEGDQLNTLMSIRRGEWTYENIMEKAKELLCEVKELHDKSTLPEEVNLGVVTDMFMEITEAE